MNVAQPEKCRTRVETTDDGLLIQRRTGSLAVAAFLMVWLSGWTVGCIVLIAMARREPTLEHVLFSVPFLVGWVFGACLLWRLVFGVETVRIGPDELEYRSTALVLLKGRNIPLAEIQGVVPYQKAVDSESGGIMHGVKANSESGGIMHGVMVVTRGRPLRFCEGVAAMEGLWLADLLQERLKGPAPKLAVKTPGVTIEALSPEGPVPEPPSDCEIEARPDWDQTVFERRGSFSILGLGAITFMVLFWNGVVGVFLLQLLKTFEWFLFFFLIPFEAIGLVIIGGWFAVLAAPFRVERWSIGAGEVGARVSVLGIGRTRRIEPKDLGRVELRKNAGNQTWFVQSGQNAESDTPYSLGLVGRDGPDRLVIGNLTEGEARWLGGEIGRILKKTLPKPGTQPSTPELCDREVDG